MSMFIVRIASTSGKRDSENLFTNISYESSNDISKASVQSSSMFFDTLLLHRI